MTAFKVGDGVKVVSNADPAFPSYRGKRGKITSCGQSWARVKLEKGGGEFTFYHKELEKEAKQVEG